MSLGQLAGERYPGMIYGDAPRNVYWEMTIACDLACKHCRADAIHTRDPRELNGEEARAMLRDIKAMGSMLILTGGDPMKRPDLFDLIEYGRSIDLPISITPSTTPTLTREVVRRFKELGIAAMGVSLDAPTAEVHDAFRGIDGTFERSQLALGWAREFKIPVQVNTTVTTGTMPHLPALYTLLKERHAPPVRRWSLFLLVPVGRGTDLGIPTAGQIEKLFGWGYTAATGFSGRKPQACRRRRSPRWRSGWASACGTGMGSSSSRTGARSTRRGSCRTRCWARSGKHRFPRSTEPRRRCSRCATWSGCAARAAAATSAGPAAARARGPMR